MGTAFQIQFVVSGPEALDIFQPPSFDSFKVVSGPNRYKGVNSAPGNPQPIENITFTLVALRQGVMRLGSAIGWLARHLTTTWKA